MTVHIGVFLHYVFLHYCFLLALFDADFFLLVFTIEFLPSFLHWVLLLSGLLTVFGRKISCSGTVDIRFI